MSEEERKDMGQEEPIDNKTEQQPADATQAPETPTESSAAEPQVEETPAENGANEPQVEEVPAENSKNESKVEGTPQNAPAAAPAAEPYKPNGYVPGEPKKGIAEWFRIIKERRLLRRDMKAHGIKNRKDFEIVAESLRLVLWKANPFFIWWHHMWTGLLAGFGLKALIGAAATALVGFFLVSTITEAKGSFTINLTGDMLDSGFVLSNTEGFEEETSRLISERMENVNNITISDIDPEVDNIDGPHNGDHYVAYTFYIKNRSDEAHSYAWYLEMTSEMLSVSEAVWIMVFEDGRQVTYTRPTAEGKPEELYGFTKELQFSDVAYNESQYYSKFDKEKQNTLYGIVTTPYADEGMVAQGLVENVQPGEVHKYTVVIWVEGNDPECTDEIFGGYAKYEMNFEDVTDKDKSSIFDGVYRTEYEDYGKNPEG